MKPLTSSQAADAFINEEMSVKVKNVIIMFGLETRMLQGVFEMKSFRSTYSLNLGDRTDK